MFLDSPDCVELIDYVGEMNDTLSMAENFSASWGDFITRYNALVSNLDDAYIATINPSDAQIMQQSIAAIRASFNQYSEDSASYVELVVGNVGSRFERKTARDELDLAFTAVNGKSQESVDKYNEALLAFNNGEYTKSKSLSRDAVILSKLDSGGDDPTIIIINPPDYTIYFVAVGILLVVILVLTFLKRGKSSEDDEDSDNEPRDKGKKEKKGDWEFVKTKQSSMERKSQSLLSSD